MEGESDAELVYRQENGLHARTRAKNRHNLSINAENDDSKELPSNSSSFSSSGSHSASNSISSDVNHIFNAETGGKSTYGRGIILDELVSPATSLHTTKSDSKQSKSNPNPLGANFRRRCNTYSVYSRIGLAVWYIGMISVPIFLFYQYLLARLAVLAWAIICCPLIACIGFVDLTVKMREERSSLYRSPLLRHTIAWLLPLITARSIFHSFATNDALVQLLSVDVWITCILCLNGGITRLMYDKQHPSEVFRKVLPSALATHGVLVALYLAGSFLVDPSTLDWTFYALPLAFSAFLSHEVAENPIFYSQFD